MLICILTKNVITSCSVTMMLFLHLEVKPLMTLTTVLYLSCALISGHLAMMRSEERFSRNAETDLVCRLLLEKKNVPAGLSDRWMRGGFISCGVTLTGLVV